VTIVAVLIAPTVVVVEVLTFVVTSIVTLAVVDEVTKVVKVVAVAVVVELMVALTAMVVLGAAAVIVDPVTPMQEQALAYFTAPEQADTYVGTELGETVTWRFIGGTTVEVVMVLVKTSVTSMVAVSDSVNVVT
jgi:hypothetical protein